MARAKLIERIRRGTFVLDGAMGTQLMLAGVDSSKADDYQNVGSPEVVRTIHAKYFEAGCDAVLTNTFGASAVALARHGLADEAGRINLAGAKLAREAAGDDRYVLGDIGPCGEFLEPLGSLKADALKDAISEQAAALLEGGVDGFIVETMTAIEEAVVAVEAARSAGDVPVFVSLAFDPARDGFKTMMGLSPVDAVAQLITLGVAGIGFNCGTLTMDGYIELTKVFACLLEDRGIALIAEPNAGRPQLVDGRATYALSPEEFADAAERICQAGANVLGGCCGTSPDHIAALVKRVRLAKP
ncbi:MAG: homocysteine S-methyltransferase family protein [Phycisphaerae bacterium]|nr:homocysteine S-methyltransferase family protein [Phycisphaerae bacterium]